jgi:hypothetical protein
VRIGDLKKHQLQASFLQNCPELSDDLAQLTVFEQFKESLPCGGVVWRRIVQPLTQNSSATLLGLVSMFSSQALKLGEGKAKELS